jgi:hypothetical protein
VRLVVVDFERAERCATEADEGEGRHPREATPSAVTSLVAHSRASRLAKRRRLSAPCEADRRGASASLRSCLHDGSLIAMNARLDSAAGSPGASG